MGLYAMENEPKVDRTKDSDRGWIPLCARAAATVGQKSVWAWYTLMATQSRKSDQGHCALKRANLGLVGSREGLSA